MKSAALGKNISGIEVTNISRHGFWLLLGDTSSLFHLKEFPWFQDASVSEIMHVEWPNPNHLYWPNLDVDLAIESIRHPEKFPLISRQSRPTKRSSRRTRQNVARG
ncbi:MAG: DUF2442 domain-containing protein [Nitrospiraceae bacterium]|nr:DUF2442 domain-containing protein [Nitrospiraceae bacterium]